MRFVLNLGPLLQNFLDTSPFFRPGVASNNGVTAKLQLMGSKVLGNRVN